MTEEPGRIAALPRLNGEPHFWFVPAAAQLDRPIRNWIVARAREASDRNVCWACGGVLGRYQSFLLGAQEALTRVTEVPPMHLGCGQYMAATRQMEWPLLRVLWTVLEFRKTTSPQTYFADLGHFPPTSLEWWSNGHLASYEACFLAVSEALKPLVADIERLGDTRAAGELVNVVAMLHKTMPKPPADSPPVAAG